MIGIEENNGHSCCECESCGQKLPESLKEAIIMDIREQCAVLVSHGIAMGTPSYSIVLQNTATKQSAKITVEIIDSNNKS